MVLYFSGTGNSAFAARRIAAQLDDTVMDLQEKIRSRDHATLQSERCWVIVAPTYAWQMPYVLRDWLEATELRGCREIYFVLTCGSSIAAAGAYARTLCQRKGLNYMGCARIVMPENYVAMFPVPGEAAAKRIVRSALPAIDAVRAAVAAVEPLPEKFSAAERFLSGPVNHYFYRLFVKDKKFTVSDKCTGCGACERGCPLRNITLHAGKPVWNGNCTHCMACICRCPAKAVEYGAASRGKPRYRCPEVTEE